MRISTKTSIALHLLVLLEVFKEEKLTSEVLAMSVGSNPVVIRNMLGSLKKANMIEIKRGVGGASLTMSPDQITLWDVYKAVDENSLNELIGMHPNPSMNCPVGSKIYALLEKPYEDVANSVKEALERHTLQEILDDYNKQEK